MEICQRDLSELLVKNEGFGLWRYYDGYYNAQGHSVPTCGIWSPGSSLHTAQQPPSWLSGITATSSRHSSTTVGILTLLALWLCAVT